MAVEFRDNSMHVRRALNDAAIAYLNEAGGELEAQAKRNTRVDTGQTQGSWTHVVDESKATCTVGSNMENAIWEEFGTGEYAAEGNGRKGGWWYKNPKTGEFVHTFGKKPNRAFSRAFASLKSSLINRARQVIGGRMNDN